MKQQFKHFERGWLHACSYGLVLIWEYALMHNGINSTQALMLFFNHALIIAIFQWASIYNEPKIIIGSTNQEVHEDKQSNFRTLINYFITQSWHCTHEVFDSLVFMAGVMILTIQMDSLWMLMSLTMIPLKPWSIINRVWLSFININYVAHTQEKKKHFTHIRCALDYHNN